MLKTFPILQTLVGIIFTLGFGGWTGCRAGQPPPFFCNLKTVVLSGDGLLLAVVQGNDNNDVALIDTKTGRTQRVLKGCGCTLDTLLFSPDDKMLATYATVCTGDSYHWEAKLWNVKTGRLQHTLEATNIGPVKNGPSVLGFTAGGQLAGTTDSDGFVRLWDTNTGKRIRLASRSQFFFSSDGVVVPMTKVLTSIIAQFPLTTPLEFCTFSPDKHFLLTLSGKNTVSGLVSADDGPGKAAVLWNAETGKQLRTFPLEGHSADSASLRGDKVLIGGEDFARVWDLGSGKMQDLWHAPSSPDKFDWFGHSQVVWARFTQSGQQADSVAVHLKAIVHKNPHEYHADWYTEEAMFFQTNTATGQQVGAFGLTGW